MSEDFLNWRGIKANKETGFSITSFIGFSITRKEAWHYENLWIRRIAARKFSTSRKVAGHYENFWIRSIKIATWLRRIKRCKEINFSI